MDSSSTTLRAWYDSQEALNELFQQTTASLRVGQLISELRRVGAQLEGLEKPEREIKIHATLMVQVTCEDESQQQELFEQLSEAGYQCRLVNL